ncbi:hypothetical protein BJX70DRAFT_387422 [Aspergillus crustosus]
MTDNTKRRRWWTQEEDQTLLEEVKAQLELSGQEGSKNWSSIADKLPGRSKKDCRKHWTKISLSSRKGTWSGAEDHLLRKAVEKFNFQWTRVAEMVGSRHPDQCANPWTPDEDQSLITAVQFIGRDWKEIGRQLFPCRSTTDIKNRYVILSRRQSERAFPESSSDASGTLVSNKCPHPMSMFTPDIDPSAVTTPCNSDIFALTPDSSIILPLTIYPSYLFDICSPAPLCDFPETQLSPPHIFENPGNTTSTLVLEELQSETANLVIEALLKTNAKFEMRLYNTGS